MPLREYACDACRHLFEELVSEGERPTCPACGGQRLTRRFSSFAVATGGRTPARSDVAGSCGSCGDPRGPGACSAD
jgi:putative FmdB family regulatory protein